MYYSSEMEWNSKWGWENLDNFNSKGSENLKKLQLTDWEVEDEGEITGAGSFKMSGNSGGSGGGGRGGGGSGSELLHNYSMKSSISAASTVSSPCEAMKASNFVHEPYMSSPMENSFVSVEPLLGLKLGKRTYFENNSSNINSPDLKKTKGSFQNGVIPHCQVHGCNLDLSLAKDYHRKHRVCDHHSKSPRVIIGGMELRFCQQCSRFHSLSDFDEKKRSCRRRLSDHNARRRKPKQETLQFHSTKLSTPLYDGIQEMNFAMDSNGGSSDLENLYRHKFTLDNKSFPWRFEKSGQASMMNVDLPKVKILPSSSSNRPSASHGKSNHVFTQGSKEAMLCFDSNGGEPKFPRALSLLSTKPWSSPSTETECIMSDRLLNANPADTATTITTVLPPPMNAAIPQGIPLGSSDFWQVEQQQQSNNFHMYNLSDYCNAHHFRS